MKAAIAHLADPNDQTAEVEYTGKIFAVLNTNGSAAWIVFDSSTGLNTTSGITGGSGNVPTKLEESTANVTNVTVASNGVLTATFNYNAPEYVADNSSVDFKVNVYANGSYYGSFNLSGTVNNGKATIPYTSSSWWWMFGTYPTDETLTFSIENERFGLMKVRYFGENNERIEDMLVNETEAVSTAAAGTTIYWTMTNKFFASTDDYVVTGVNGAPIKGTCDTVGKVTGANGGQPVVASGYEYVDVKLTGYTTATPNYAITKSADMDSNYAAAVGATGDGVIPTTMDKFGLTGATSDKLRVYWTKTTNAAQYDMVTFTAEVTGNTDANSYDVTVNTSNGSFTIEGVGSTGTASAKNYSFKMPAADVVVESISVKIADSKLAVESAKVVDNVLTLVFNADLKNDPDGSPAVTPSVAGAKVHEAKLIAPNTLEVTFKTALANGDQIILSNVKHDTYNSDSLSSTLTYDANAHLFK